MLRSALVLIGLAIAVGALAADEGAGLQLLLPTGQNGFIEDAVYSRQGGLILTASAGSSTAVLWQAKSGIRLREFRCGTGSAIRLPLAIADDTRTALLGCPDRTVLLVDLHTGAVLHRAGPYGHSIGAVAYSPEAGRIVVVAGEIVLVDLVANRIIGRLPGRWAPKNVLLSRSGRCALVWNDNVQVADLQTWQYTSTIENVRAISTGAIADDCVTAALSDGEAFTYVIRAHAKIN